MSTGGPPGPVGSIVLAILAVGAAYCAVDAIVSESVTTPSLHGDGKLVHGSDTILVGIGWLLMGLGFTAKIMLRPPGGHAGTVTAVVLIVAGALCWFVAI
jgi:hypothetical protein